MPVLDMPLHELEKYEGVSPCPSDIDQYWDKALEEMNNINPQVSLTRSEFQVPNTECFDLYFTGVGNSRIYAKYLRPKNITGKIPCVVQFHGYSGNAGDWHSKLAYVNMGYAVAAMDCRGQGGRSGDISSVKGNTLCGHIIRGLDDSIENLYFRRVFLDAAQIAGIVMNFDEIDETKIVAAGGSQGGGLTVACAAFEPQVKIALAQYPFLADYKRVWDMDLCKGAYQEFNDYFRRFDPRHLSEDEIFYILGYIDIQNIAKRIKADVVWSVGLMDNICPPSTQYAVYNKITAKKEIHIYPDYGHEEFPEWSDISAEYLVKNL